MREEDIDLVDAARIAVRNTGEPLYDRLANEIERLREALRACVEDMEALEEGRHHCGDPDAECPMQDWGARDCVGDKSLKMARAALDRMEG